MSKNSIHSIYAIATSGPENHSLHTWATNQSPPHTLPTQTVTHARSSIILSILGHCFTSLPHQGSPGLNSLDHFLITSTTGSHNHLSSPSVSYSSVSSYGSFDFSINRQQIEVQVRVKKTTADVVNNWCALLMIQTTKACHFIARKDINVFRRGVGNMEWMISDSAYPKHVAMTCWISL